MFGDWKNMGKSWEKHGKNMDHGKPIGTIGKSIYQCEAPQL